jgi:hypothetical protein
MKEGAVRANVQILNQEYSQKFGQKFGNLVVVGGKRKKGESLHGVIPIVFPLSGIVFQKF